MANGDRRRDLAVPFDPQALMALRAEARPSTRGTGRRNCADFGTGEESKMRVTANRAEGYGNGPDREHGSRTVERLGRRRDGGASPALGGRHGRVDLFDLGEADWASRIMTALAEGPRTLKGLGRLQGACWRPTFYRALHRLEAEGAIVCRAPGRRQRKWHYTLREDV